MFPLSLKISVGYGFLLLWVILLQSFLPISTACIEDERSSLLDFKAGLNLSSGRLISWRGFNCCQWEGVTCEYHSSHVMTLDLSNSPAAVTQMLSGEINPSLFNLQHLQHLDLSSNDFRGNSIPSQISKLQRLSYLSLLNAGFGGEVPVELGNISSLRHLDISDNYWNFRNFNQRLFQNSNKFDECVRGLRSLEFLGMNEVNLTMGSERWGEALSGLHNLTQIHLSYCRLSGNIPDLSNLTSLSHLHLAGNSFPFVLPSWLQNVSSLVSLDLSHCNLNGSIPSNFMPRSKLQNLDLSGNYDLKGNLSFILGHSSALVALSLSDCNLSGQFPRSAANYSKLETMEGTIPSSFHSLSSLAHLELSNSQLSGRIPDSISKLASLRVLSLDHNNLTGQIPPSLCELSTLKELHLGYNQLSGTIPDCILKMARLEGLTLASNRLRGNISLHMLDNLTRLRAVELSENQLSITISTSWVPQFNHLEFLALRSCNIEGSFPAFLSQQYQLEELDLSSNDIVGNLPPWLWDLPNLDVLIISDNKLEGSLPRQISHKFEVVDLQGNRLYGSLPTLDFCSFILDLSDNEFNGSIPSINLTFPGVQNFLSLAKNNLSGEIPSFSCPDSDIPGTLDLSNNKLTGKIPANIGSCSNLYIFKLAHNDLGGKIPEELGNLTTLSTLNLNGNRFQGNIPPFLSNCIGLQVFDLGNNKLEGSIPVWIEKLKDLRILSLTSNKFEGIIPPQLMRLPNLRILDLSSNHLSEGIPQNLSELYALVNQSQTIHEKLSGPYSIREPYMDSDYESKFEDEVTIWIKGRAQTYKKIIYAQKFMDLSRNNLSGNIPLEFGLLQGLISLNLSNNNLCGPIPESLAVMVRLESLDLSDNKLSGRIPSQLSNLTFLSVLNLSNNMLSGLIPQGKQFATFEASSFLGNLNLYGFPLQNMTLGSGSNCAENKGEWNKNTEAKGSDSMERWWAVGLGLSYGIGFATVIAVLCFHIKWRYICFQLMDNFIYQLFEH